MSNLPVPVEPEKSKKKSGFSLPPFASYFFQGILLIAPVLLTFYVIYWIIAFIDSLVPAPIPGLGLLIFLVAVTIIGFLSNNFLIRPLFERAEGIITRLPLANIIYTSLKDLFSAFVSEKKKFDQPVLVVFNKQSGLKKMGFITQEDVSDLGLEGHAAVYFPHSYNFSGNLYIVPKENIIPLPNLSATEAMKFIVSGGVTAVNPLELPEGELKNSSIKPKEQ